LGIRQAGKGPTGVVVEEAGVEDPDYAETAVLGDHAKRSELSLGAGDQNDVAYFCAEVAGHVLTEDDGGHRGNAFVHSGERVRGMRGSSGLGRRRVVSGLIKFFGRKFFC
jgi:hypothetical protein